MIDKNKQIIKTKGQITKEKKQIVGIIIIVVIIIKNNKKIVFNLPGTFGSVIALAIPNLQFEIGQIDKLALLISDLKRNHADTANERG